MLRSIQRLYADAFRGLPGTVWRLSIGLFVNRAGTMVLPFLSLYLVRELGYDTAATSAVLFAFGLGSVVGSYLGGVISSSLGTVRVQVGSLLLAGAGFLVLGQLHDFKAMVAAVFVVSAVSDAYRPACMAAVVQASTPEVRARAMGLMRLAANAGMTLGPAAGGVLAGIDYRWIFVGEAVTCWCAAAWLLRSLSGEQLHPPIDPAVSRPPAGRALWRDGPFLALLGLVFVATLVLFQVFSTLPLYLTSAYGLDERQVGLMFGFNGALIVAFEMVLIHRLERRDPCLVLAFGIFLMCVGFGLLPFGSGLLYAAFTVTVWTTGEMLWLPFSNVLVAQRAGPERAGAAMGMYTAVLSVGLVLAPVLGLAVLERLGGDVLWAMAGLVGIPLGLGTALLAKSLRAPAEAAAGDGEAPPAGGADP